MTTAGSARRRRPSAAHDAERLEVWRLMTLLVARTDMAARSELAEVHGVSLSEFRVLDALAGARQARPVGEIALEAGIVASTLTRQIDRLEEREWVTRQAGSAQDHRHVVIRLTPQGRQVWRSASTVVRRVLRNEILTEWSDQDLVMIRDGLKSVLEA